MDLSIRLIRKILLRDGRTSKIARNALLSTILKMISVAISFIMVPIALNYLDRDGYGLWAALSSTLAWLFIFDIGIGNGLRNRFTELKTNGQVEDIKYYVSTAYFIFSVIAFVIVLFFLIANIFIDWGNLLNASRSMTAELGITVTIVFTGMCLIFVAKLINTILLADLKSGISDSISVISHGIALIGLLIIREITTPSLIYFALVYTGSNLIVTFSASIYLFKTMYKPYAPKIQYIKITLWKSLVTIGVKFFIIQIFSLVLFQTSALILSNLVGPQVVADYTITSRYYSIATLIFMMLTQPLWTGYGEAYYKSDYSWIRLTFKRLRKLWLLLSAVLVLMLLVQKTVYRFWLHDKIEVNYFLSLLFVIFYSLQMWATIYEPFINSTSKLKIQLLISSVLVPLFIPFSILLVRDLALGPAGILIATLVLSGLPMAFVSWYQAKKILENSTGIWTQ